MNQKKPLTDTYGEARELTPEDMNNMVPFTELPADLQTTLNEIGHPKNQTQAPHADVDQAMDRPYQPISCSGHDQLLALATLRQECRLTVNAEDGAATDIHGIIEDVYTSKGAEYLRLRDGSIFRLDRIQALDGRPLPSV